MAKCDEVPLTTPELVLKFEQAMLAEAARLHVDDQPSVNQAIQAAINTLGMQLWQGGLVQNRSD